MSVNARQSAPQSNDTKKKKPFFKKIWFWILIIIVIIGIGSQGLKRSNSSTEKQPSVNSQSASSTGKSSGSAAAEQDNLKEIFEKINLSDTSGTTKEEAEQMIGKKSDSSSSSNLGDTQTELLTWNLGIMKSITVDFSNNHAVGKHVIGLKPSKKISLEEFNQIQNGMSEDDVKAKLGEPSGINITNLLGVNTTMLTFDGTALGSSGTVTFTDGAVSGVANMNLK